LGGVSGLAVRDPDPYHPQFLGGEGDRV